LLGCASILAAGFLLDVDEAGVYLLGWKWPLHCFLAHNFGVNCALCGMTRSIAAMGQGNFKAAWGFHHLGPAVFLFIILQLPYRMWALCVYPRGVPRIVYTAAVTGALLLVAAIMLNWLFYLVGSFL